MSTNAHRVSQKAQPLTRPEIPLSASFLKGLWESQAFNSKNWDSLRRGLLHLMNQPTAPWGHCSNQTLDVWPPQRPRRVREDSCGPSNQAWIGPAPRLAEQPRPADLVALRGEAGEEGSTHSFQLSCKQLLRAGCSATENSIFHAAHGFEGVGGFTLISTAILLLALHLTAFLHLWKAQLLL